MPERGSWFERLLVQKILNGLHLDNLKETSLRVVTQTLKSKCQKDVEKLEESQNLGKQRSNKMLKISKFLSVE